MINGKLVLSTVLDSEKCKIHIELYDLYLCFKTELSLDREK